LAPSTGRPRRTALRASAARELFPNLAARQNNPAGVLSGGEQQMLTMCRTLMGDPDLILIDEPTEGLAPMLVTQVGHLLEEIARRGVSILLVAPRHVFRGRVRPRWCCGGSKPPHRKAGSPLSGNER